MAKILKIGILRETKHPAERRAPITPLQAAILVKSYPSLKLFVQSSNTRIFTDDEYMKEGIQVKDNINDCDWFIGIKEVNKEDLIEAKSYLFFSHVIKKQAHNRDLFMQIIRKKVSLVDYELFTDEKGSRLVAFGRWAGIVGAYNGLRAWGLKHNRFELKPAYLSQSKDELYKSLSLLTKPSLKILLTGEGRVAGGVIEILRSFGAESVGLKEFIKNEYPIPVFCQIGPQHYVRHITGQTFDFRHFALFPNEYSSIFSPLTRTADMLITAHFWDPSSPGMINLEDVQRPGFRIKLIADISCDIKGPIVSTVRASTIEDPFYDFDPVEGIEKPAFSHERNITVMAVDNLPAELPRDSSESFGETLLKYVFPAITGQENIDLLDRATIVRKGKITQPFNYLKAWTQ